MGDPRTKNPLCRSCSRSGSNSPTWKGGHVHWQAGKLGRDKEGLSWKEQRRLCRERDNHTCQDCGKHKDELGYEPHCDHEVPYRISFSHALTNLKLRCRSCHKIAEATRPDLWGGKTFGGHVGKTPRIPCISCGNNRRKKKVQGRCLRCYRKEILVPKAVAYRSQGKSYEEIGDLMGVDHKTVWKWINSSILWVNHSR